MAGTFLNFIGAEGIPEVPGIDPLHPELGWTAPLGDPTAGDVFPHAASMVAAEQGLAMKSMIRDRYRVKAITAPSDFIRSYHDARQKVIVALDGPAKVYINILVAAGYTPQGAVKKSKKVLEVVVKEFLSALDELYDRSDVETARRIMDKRERGKM